MSTKAPIWNEKGATGSPRRLLSIPALSLHQPWASAMEVGDKRIETRGWATRVRGLLAIHAARKWTLPMQSNLGAQPFDRVRKKYAVDDIPRGAIVAVTLLVDCVPTHFFRSTEFRASLEHNLGNYHNGRYALITHGTIPLSKPWPYRGGQKFFRWEVDSELLAQLLGGQDKIAGGVARIISEPHQMMGCLKCGKTSIGAAATSSATCPFCKE